MTVEKAELAGVPGPTAPGGAKGGITLGRLIAEKIMPGHIGHACPGEASPSRPSDGSRLKARLSRNLRRRLSALFRQGPRPSARRYSRCRSPSGCQAACFFDRFALDDLVVSPTDGGEVGLKGIRGTMTGSLAEATGFDLDAAGALGRPDEAALVRATASTRRSSASTAFVLNIDVQSRYDPPAGHTIEIPRYTFTIGPQLATLKTWR